MKRLKDYPLPISIIVMDIDGKAIRVKIQRLNILAHGLKASIFLADSTPIDDQKLMFNGLELEDNHGLHYCGVRNYSTVRMMSKFRRPVWPLYFIYFISVKLVGWLCVIFLVGVAIYRKL